MSDCVISNSYHTKSMALLGRPLDSQLNVEMNLVRVLKETKNTEIYITLNIRKKVFLLLLLACLCAFKTINTAKLGSDGKGHRSRVRNTCDLDKVYTLIHLFVLLFPRCNKHVTTTLLVIKILYPLLT